MIKSPCLSLLLLSPLACTRGPAVPPDLSAAPAGAAVPVKRTDLVSDRPGAATYTDPDLVNAWGSAFDGAGTLWVSANSTGLARAYGAGGQIQPIAATIPPPPGGSPPAAPTGQVWNGGGAFLGDRHILATEDGTLVGWQAGAGAVLRADRSGRGAVYKGLALATQGSASRLYATDFHNGRVDVYDEAYQPLVLAGAFTDAGIPAGYAPFGAYAAGDTVYITYAMQGAQGHDDAAGAGRGYVDAYDFDGRLKARVASGGVLDSPWGLAVAPADFGALGGALLVGNFGDGRIHAFDPAGGGPLGTLAGADGAPLAIEGLWSLSFGDDAAGAAHDQLFFSGGPGSEKHGVVGRLERAP